MAKKQYEMKQKCDEFYDYLNNMAGNLQGVAMPDFQTQWDAVDTALTQVKTYVDSNTSGKQVIPPVYDVFANDNF